MFPNGSLPEELLKRAASIRFIRLDFQGFLFTCKVKKNDIGLLVVSLRKHYAQLSAGQIDVSQEGQSMIRVSGQWWNDGRPAYAQEKDFAKLDTIYRSRTYFLKSPEIIGNNLRVILVADERSLKTLQSTICNVGLTYNVKKLGSLERSDDSALDKLTQQQMRILRLAYAEGYYEIPRRISTRQLASLLKMDEGTVGEHLRRAEKNLMDFLMTS